MITAGNWRTYIGAKAPPVNDWDNASSVVSVYFTGLMLRSFTRLLFMVFGVGAGVASGLGV